MSDKKVKVVVKSEGGKVPFYASDGAAGADVSAKLEGSVFLQPSEVKGISTGLFFDIPSGYEIQVRPRSGLALKYGITVLNSPGTIDCDYRGELCVILINHSKNIFEVKDGMRIAQIVVAQSHQVDFIEGKELSCTVRGENGFGHTGV